MDLFNKLWEQDLDSIWEIKDENAFVIAMYGWICRRCNYGENIATLSVAQQNVYLVRVFEDEVNNGGFSQYICQSSGENVNKALPALLDVGAKNTAGLYQKVLNAIGMPIPQSEDARMGLFTEDNEKILSECEKDFFTASEDLTGLIYQYILKHKEQFAE